MFRSFWFCIRMVQGVAKGRDVKEFLMAQLTKDLEQVAQCTGKSVDDTIILMHHILHNMRKFKVVVVSSPWLFKHIFKR